MTAVYVAEEHHAVLEHWRSAGVTGIALVHVDEHCDMRGLLVDRKRQRAAAVPWDRLVRRGIVYGGNFLAHAALEGRLHSVRWVHGPAGGRSRDVETVKYETDLTALPWRVADALGLSDTTPLGFEVLGEERFDGVRRGEILDVDWDFVAGKGYHSSQIDDRADALLDRLGPVPPELAYLVYSPYYVHPSREQFERFARLLARRLAGEVTVLPPAQTPSSAGYLLPPAVRAAAKGALKRIGIR